MGETTTISWTDHTFSPWWGCTKITAPADEGSACDHCYAAALAHRYGHDVWGKDAPRRELSDANWAKPLRWERLAAAEGRPHLVFCGSMCDVFEHRVPDDLGARRARLWELVDATPHLIWQFLTKRPEWVPTMVPRHWMHGGWPDNAWLGATVEAPRFARIRLPRLLKIPAPIRFVSMEPLLAGIDLARWLPDRYSGDDSYRWECQAHGMAECDQTPECAGVQWVIVGGESGSPRRTLDHDDARAIRDQCAVAGVPYFFKQDSGPGSGVPGPDDLMVRQFPEAARR